MPDPLVCVGVFTAVAVFSAVTLAPTTTAPLGSITWPVIAPVTVWPNADDRHSGATTEQASQNCNQYCILFVVMFGLITSGLLDCSAQASAFMEWKCSALQ